MGCVPVASNVKPMSFVKRHLLACLTLGLLLLVGGAVGYSYSEPFGWMVMVAGAILLCMCRVTTFTAANEAWHRNNRGGKDGA